MFCSFKTRSSERLMWQKLSLMPWQPPSVNLPAVNFKTTWSIRPTRNSQETHNSTLVSHTTESPQLVQTTTTAGSGTKGTVLLQTARAVATNEDGTKSSNVWILFDNVTNTLKPRLSLEPLRKETLHLNTFGEQRYRTQDCDVWKSVWEELVVKKSKFALVFPVLCSSLPHKIQGKQVSLLRRLRICWRIRRRRWRIHTHSHRIWLLLENSERRDSSWWGRPYCRQE